MSIVKKWASCVVSFVAGVLGLALSTCSGMVVNASIDASAINSAFSNSSTEVVKAYKVLTDSTLLTDAQQMGISTEFVWMKVFAIITTIVSILLIAYSVVLLLKNLNVIKAESKAFDIVTIVLGIALLVAIVGMMITTGVYANALETATIGNLKALYASKGLTETMLSVVKFDVVAKLGVYQWIMLPVSLITAGTNCVFPILNRKNA